MLFFKSQNQPSNQPMDPSLLHPYEKILDLGNRSRALDYGCYQGNNLSYLCGKAELVYASHRDAAALRSLQDRHLGFSNLSFLPTTDLVTLPNASLSHVFCMTGPEHMLYYELCHDLYHFGRILETGGKVLIDFVDISAETSFFPMLNELNWFREREQDINDMSLLRPTTYHPQWMKSAFGHLGLALNHEQSFFRKGQGWGPFELKWCRQIYEKT